MSQWIIFSILFSLFQAFAFRLSANAQETYTLISAKSHDGVPIIASSKEHPDHWSTSSDSLDFTVLSGKPDLQLFQKLGVHVNEDLLFISDGKRGDMHKITLNEAITGSATIYIVNSYTSSEIGGITVDWSSNNIYWTDQVYRWLLLSTWIKGSNLRYTVIDTDLEKPGGIAVHPKSSQLFWTDYGSYPKIERSTLEGEERKSIVWTGLTSPKFLNIDHRTDTLYWIDTSRNVIGSCHLDGSDVTWIYQGDFLSSYVGFTLFENFLIGISNERHELYRHNLSQPSDYTTTRVNIGEIYDIQTYAASEQPALTSPCSTAPCTHMCVGVNSNTEYKCLCSEGYNLVHGYECQANEYYEGPLYIYTLNNAFCWYHVWTPVMTDEELSHSCYATFTTSGKYHVGHLFSQHYFYFATPGNIQRSLARHGDNTVYLLKNLGDIQGFSVDWISLNMYWATSEGIMVATTEGRHIDKLLILAKLNGLVVEPLHGHLYFTISSTPTTGYIGRAFLDGSSVVPFVNGSIGQPEQLVVDYPDSRLYWTDSLLDRVESIKLDGTDRKVVITVINSHPFGLATFQNHLVWTDQTSEEPGLHWTYKDGTDSVVRSVLKTQITGNIALYGEYSQPTNFTTACSNANGGCTDLCLPTPTSRTCRCGRGYRLEPDGKTCKTDMTVLDAGLVFTEKIQTGIFQMDPNTETLSAIPVTSLISPEAIDIDLEEGLIFWTDIQQKSLQRSTFLGSDDVTIKQLNSDAYPRGIAVDWMNKIIIYTDAGNGVIMRMNYSGGNDLILISAIDKPHGITLDFSNSKMYWTDRGITPKIETATYDGSDRDTVVSTVNMGWPNGITIDQTAQVLYWCDGKLGRVESVNTDGSNRRLLHVEQGEQYFGVALLNDYLYLTSLSNGHLQKIHKDGGTKSDIGDRILMSTHGIASYKRATIETATIATPTTTATALNTSPTITPTTHTTPTTETTTLTTVNATPTTTNTSTSLPKDTVSNKGETTMIDETIVSDSLPDLKGGEELKSEEDFSTGIIITVALVILAVIVIAICITIGIYCCIKNRRNSNGELPHLTKDRTPAHADIHEIDSTSRPDSAVYNTIDGTEVDTFQSTIQQNTSNHDGSMDVEASVVETGPQNDYLRPTCCKGEIQTSDYLTFN